MDMKMNERVVNGGLKKISKWKKSNRNGRYLCAFYGGGMVRECDASVDPPGVRMARS